VAQGEETKRLIRGKDDQLEILGMRIEAWEKDGLGELGEAKREFERFREVERIERENLMKIVSEKDQEIYGLRGVKQSLETNLKKTMNVSSDETKKIETSLRDKTNEISRLVEKVSGQESQISDLKAKNQILVSTAGQDSAEIIRLKQESQKHELDFKEKLKEKASQVEDYKKKIGKNVELLDKKIRSNDDEIRSYKRKIGE
jgi:DNA repair exonuclease SbcCD ATPase subunit